MAKDFTNRGGARTGAGRKPKGITEKLENGNPGKRKLQVMEFADELPELEGVDVPPIKEFMKKLQKDGTTNCAEEIYNETWKWLIDRKCENLVKQQLVEQYAMAVARWIQCENCISEYGFLAKHPTTGAAITSPYVAMAQSFMKQSNQLWFQIFQVVKENCTVDFKSSNPQEDMMEYLLTHRKPYTN